MSWVVITFLVWEGGRKCMQKWRKQSSIACPRSLTYVRALACLTG
jgi:hypothetical protein